MAPALPALLRLTEWEIMPSDARNIKSRSPGMINFAMFSDIRYLYHSTLPKAQRNRGLSALYQSNFFRSYHKFSFRISTKHQLHNLNQTPESKSRLNLNSKILTKSSFRISTKLQFHNINQTSVSKHWQNFKISTGLQLQNLDQTSSSISWKIFSVKISTKLLPTRSLSSTSWWYQQ